MTQAPPQPSDTPPHPDDEHEPPDVSTVPHGAVAVFQAPRAVRPGNGAPGNGAPPGNGAVPPPAGGNGRPEIESPFLDLFGPGAHRGRHQTVEGTVVAESRADTVPPVPVSPAPPAIEAPPQAAPATTAPAPAHRKARSKKAKPAPPPTVKRPKHKDRDPAQDLAITEIAGHLTYTPNTVTAWYWLPEVRWAFRPDAEREALLMAIAEQYAGLAGFRIHLRRTTRPFPADEWARNVDQMTQAPLPNVPGATSWADHLVSAQHHLLSVNHAEGQTYLGVTFARRKLGDTTVARVRNVFGKGIGDGEHRRMARMVEQFRSEERRVGKE